MSGEHLKAIRIKKGISQVDIANELKVVRQTVSKWEHDQSAPDPEQIKQLARFFEVDCEWLTEQIKKERSANQAKKDVFESMSDNVENLVSGQEQINASIFNNQEEIIKELRKLEETQIQYNVDRELVKQKKIRTVAIIVACVLIVVLVGIFLYILRNEGVSGEIYEGPAIIKEIKG